MHQVIDCSPVNPATSLNTESDLSLLINQAGYVSEVEFIESMIERL